MMLEGDLYKGTSPHVVGTAISNDQTSGGDLNFRYPTIHADGTGLMAQAIPTARSVLTVSWATPVTPSTSILSIASGRAPLT